MSFERTTPCGVISGTACQWPGIAAYKGIRYATAGRWEFPVPVTHWDGVYDATQYGACCYQPRAFYDEAAAPGKAFYYNEFRKGETYTYSEDCLFLNIWTPADAAPEDKLPVIFYIHGGGFTGGCSHEKHFDGPVWPTKGCVAVTINYRLGPMGFVCLPELAEEAGSTGSYAFLDQLAALQWVRANIAAFGGDPNNITIMGQSAGAMSVQQLVLSPITRGLFSKAVMSSGGGVSQMLTAKPAEAHYPFWKQVMETAGCSTLAEFRALAPARLFAAWDAAAPSPSSRVWAVSPWWMAVSRSSPALRRWLPTNSTIFLTSLALPARISFRPTSTRWLRTGAPGTPTATAGSSTASSPVMTVVPGIPATCGTGSARWLTAGGPSPRRTPPSALRWWIT